MSSVDGYGRLWKGLESVDGYNVYGREKVVNCQALFFDYYLNFAHFHYFFSSSFISFRTGKFERLSLVDSIKVDLL